MIADVRASKFREAAVLLMLALFVIASRWPLRSAYLIEGDSVNYALALESFDPAQDRPHPPGYIFYIGLARLVRPLFGDANAALTGLSVLFSVGAVLMTYVAGRTLFSKRSGLLAAVLLAANPFFWFYGLVALNYAALALGGTAIALASWRLRHAAEPHRPGLVLGLLAGIGSGFRPDLLIYLSPLVIWVLVPHRRNARTIVIVAVTGLASVLAWYLPTVVLSGGLGTYRAAAQWQIETFVSNHSVLFGNPFLVHARMVKEFLLTLLSATLVVSPMLVYATIRWPRRSSGNAGRGPRIFLALWFFPAFLFFSLVYFEQPGYLLVLVPPCMMAAGEILARWAGRQADPTQTRHRVFAIAVASVAVQTALFFSPPLFDSYAFRGRSSESGLTSFAASSVHTVLNEHSLRTIRSCDLVTGAYVDGLRQIAAASERIALVHFHRSPWAFGLSYYYFREGVTVLVPDWEMPVRVFWVARDGRKSLGPASGLVELPGGTTSLAVITDREAPAYRMMTWSGTPEDRSPRPDLPLLVIRASHPSLSFDRLRIVPEGQPDQSRP